MEVGICVFVVSGGGEETDFVGEGWSADVCAFVDVLEETFAGGGVDRFREG